MIRRSPGVDPQVEADDGAGCLRHHEEQRGQWLSPGRTARRRTPKLAGAELGRRGQVSPQQRTGAVFCGGVPDRSSPWRCGSDGSSLTQGVVERGVGWSGNAPAPWSHRAPRTCGIEGNRILLSGDALVLRFIARRRYLVVASAHPRIVALRRRPGGDDARSSRFPMLAARPSATANWQVPAGSRRSESRSGGGDPVHQVYLARSFSQARAASSSVWHRRRGSAAPGGVMVAAAISVSQEALVASPRQAAVAARSPVDG